jgi:hypothetical protein
VALKMVRDGVDGAGESATQTQTGKAVDGAEVTLQVFADGARVQRCALQGSLQVVLPGDRGVYQTKEEADAGDSATQKELVAFGKEQVMWERKKAEVDSGGGEVAGADGAGVSAGVSAGVGGGVGDGVTVWATPDGNRVVHPGKGVVMVSASTCKGYQFQVQPSTSGPDAASGSASSSASSSSSAAPLQVTVIRQDEAGNETAVQLMAVAPGSGGVLDKDQGAYGLVTEGPRKMQVDGTGGFTVEER